MDKYRFKQLLESQMGNVKPLINEFWSDIWLDDKTYYRWAINNKYGISGGESSLSDGANTFGRWDYNKIENSSKTDDIATLIFHSKAGHFVPFDNDTEAVAEAAFMALTKNPGWYGSVKNAMGGTDPYDYCKSFMTIDKVYHRQSVHTSYKIIKEKNPKLT